jgi:hypothetical protein
VWYHCTDVHALTEDETDDVKDSFYEESEHAYNEFPKHNMKIRLGDFSVKAGRKAF